MKDRRWEVVMRTTEEDVGTKQRLEATCELQSASLILNTSYDALTCCTTDAE